MFFVLAPLRCARPRTSAHHENAPITKNAPVTKNAPCSTPRGHCCVRAYGYLNVRPRDTAFSSTTCYSRGTNSETICSWTFHCCMDAGKRFVPLGGAEVCIDASSPYGLHYSRVPLQLRRVRSAANSIPTVLYMMAFVTEYEEIPWRETRGVRTRLGDAVQAKTLVPAIE